MDAKAAAMAAVAVDLATAPFLRGIANKRWNVIDFTFPELLMEVSGTNSDGSSRSYGFRFLLDGFPTNAPDVRCWDLVSNSNLHSDQRPKVPARTAEAFKEWGYGVYRPWERNGGTHNNWASLHPNLAWHAARILTFILEDLHELLNAYPRKTATESQATTTL